MADKNPTISETSIAGIFQINRQIFADERGFFREVMRKEELEEVVGYSFQLVQVNHSRSKKDVLRGIHAAPWVKVIYVPRGLVQSVLVDLREDSPQFGQHLSIHLGEENNVALFLPPGIGNSFLTLSEEADVTYFAGDYWQPDKEVGIIWNDPDLKISWEGDHPLLSEKDQRNLFFKRAFPKKF